MKIFRFEVPVDDRWHTVTSGQVLSVGCRKSSSVEFWAVAGESIRREYRVFGTGQEASGEYVGTHVSPNGILVWHLFRRPVQVGSKATQ